MTHQRLNGHKVNPANDVINIIVADELGSGGANHAYLITGIAKLIDNPSTQVVFDALDTLDGEGVEVMDQSLLLLFQNGPIPQAGVNGITHEVLLEILIHRIQGFQNGPFACQANQDCLDHLKTAQELLLNRTRERMARGVEGTHKV